jgi:hypothetical protein
VKRFYQNLSNETMTYRVWMLVKEDINEADFIWLKAFNIPIRIDQPTHTFETMGGGRHAVVGKRTVTLETTTDKQRNMIVLKYGNDAVLIQEDIVFPGTMSTCTLSEVKW